MTSFRYLKSEVLIPAQSSDPSGSSGCVLSLDHGIGNNPVALSAYDQSVFLSTASLAVGSCVRPTYANRVVPDIEDRRENMISTSSVLLIVARSYPTPIA